jgi:hypothetical protein
MQVTYDEHSNLDGLKKKDARATASIDAYIHQDGLTCDYSSRSNN